MENNIKKINKIEKWEKEFFTFKIFPARHFNRLVITCLVIFVGIITYHGYLYYQIKFVDIQISDEGQIFIAPTVNSKKLESVLNKYEQKAKTQLSILSASSTVIDPSK